MAQAESTENKRVTGSTRRLTAIMFTDMVGYSALVQKNEPLAMELLDTHRKLVRKLIRGFGGREVETAGDSFLIEFGSALDAMNCAIAMQQRHTLHNTSTTAERHITIRIGVHVGDIEHRQGGKVFGDGVNLAARIEPLAPHGGIAVSSQLHAQIKHRISASFRSLGHQALKNIAEPMEVFALDSGAIAALPAPESRARLIRLDWRWAAASVGALAAVVIVVVILRTTPADAPDKSVAVLPFANLSEDKANAYFADGMQDEILTALSRIKALKVISRTSTEQYRGKPHDLPSIAQALGVATVLEGGVQRTGNRVRINVQLIDANTDAHLWAESYDRELSDIFAVQSEIALKVADALKASLLPAEAQTLAAVPTQNTRAYDLYVQAGALFRRIDGGDLALLRPAIAMYEQALAEDPAFALAAADLARVHLWLYWYTEDQTPTRLALAKTAIDRALALQPGLPEAHAMLGLYHYWGHRDYPAALTELERAQKALPNNAFVAGIIAAVARRQGLWDRAVEGLTHSTRLDPLNVSVWTTLGQTYCVLRRYAECEASLGRTAVLSPPWYWTFLKGYARAAAQGDLATLRAAVAELPAAPDGIKAYAAYLLAWWSRGSDGAMKALAASPTPWLGLAGSIYVPKTLLMARLRRLNGDAPHARVEFMAARQALEAALASQPGSPKLLAGLGLAHSGLGEHALAVAAAQRAVDLLPLSADALDGVYLLTCLAEVHAAASNKESALEILERLAAIPAGLHVSPALLKLDPVWDPLRQEARFQKMLSEPLSKS